MTKQNATPPTCGVADAARLLGCSRSAIRKAIARGVLPATLTPGQRRGNEYRILVRDVRAYGRKHQRPRKAVQS